MLGHHPHTSETPFKWRFAGGPILNPIIDKQQKTTRKKTLLKLILYDKTFRIRACHTSSADRGLLETYRLSTVMSTIRKVGTPPPPSI